MGQTFNKKETYLPNQLIPQNNLYGTLRWDLKVVRKLIIDKKVAPFYLGKSEPGPEGDYEECPICFFNYQGGLNISKCCRKGLCTECYFSCQLPDVGVACPFCRASQFSVVFNGPKTPEERLKEAEEIQKILAYEKRLEEEKEKTKELIEKANETPENKKKRNQLV